MEKILCNYISKNGRCKEKATRIVVFKITDTFNVRTKLCKKHYGETKGLQNRKIMVELSKEEWLKKGKELYGEEVNDWKFKCSNCGRIQSASSIREQMKKGEKSQRWGILEKGDDFDPSTSCYSPSCNWVSNGLFNSGILVIIDSTKPHNANLLKNCTYVFPFADFNWGE